MSGADVPAVVKVSRLRPTDLPNSPAFAHGVMVEGPARTIYVGGQNGIGPDSQVVSDEVAVQTRQALSNIARVLAEARGHLSDVVHWRIALAQGAPLEAAFTAFADLWMATHAEPPAISVDIVAGLARSAFLIEITAIAVVAP